MTNSDQSITVNGITITQSIAATFAPIICTHKTERYKSCDISYLLQGANWVQVGSNSDGAPDWSDPGTPLPGTPTPNGIGQLPNGGSNVKININPNQFGGQADANGNWNAPMYVCPQVPSDASFVDLNYIFLYAYNGPQSVRLYALGVIDCSTPHFAEHQGDVESITVRVKPDFSSVIFVRFEAHGGSTYYLPETVKFDDSGKRPYVGCALNSHASYNIAGQSSMFTAVLDSWGEDDIGVNVVEIVDFIDPNGPQWNLTDPSQFILVGLQNGVAVNNQLWAQFQGRLGGYQTNSLGYITGANGDLSPADQITAESVAAIAVVANLIPEENLTNYGPGGLAVRGIIVVDQPTPATQTSVVLRPSQRPYLALTVDPTNLEGTPIVAPYTTGNSNQIWNQITYGNLYMLVNELSGMAISGPNDNALTAQVSQLTMNASDFWDQSGEAIRPHRNTNMNLNVAAMNNIPQADAKICVWQWGGGKPNETWRVDTNGSFPWPPASVSLLVKTSQRPLYLTTDGSGGVTVEPFSGNFNQQWFQIDYGCGYVLVSGQSNQAICGASDRSAVTLVQVGYGGDSALWNTSDDGAIRTQRDWKMNLNVFAGNNVPQAGATVGIWDWGHGNPNETWSLNAWSNPPQSQLVAVKCQNDDLALSANADGSGLTVSNYNSGSVSSGQIWILSNQENGYMTFQHQLSGLYLVSPWPNDNAGVWLGGGGNLSDSYLWNQSGAAIRVFRNTNQNLNVASSTNQPASGDSICTWKWGGGKNNEIWSIVSV